MLNRMLNGKGKGLSRSFLVGITDGGLIEMEMGGLIIMLIDGYRQSINPSLKLITDEGRGRVHRNEKGANHNTLPL